MLYLINSETFIQLDLGREGLWSQWKYCTNQSYASELALQHERSIFPAFRAELVGLVGIGILCKQKSEELGRYYQLSMRVTIIIMHQKIILKRAFNELIEIYI